MFGLSTSVCCYNSVYPESLLQLPLECFTVTSVAFGLLVTFKTQTSYARFIEGRNLWGWTVNESRAMSSRIMARVQGSGNPKVKNAQQHAVKHLRSFPITLKYHLTEDGCNPHIPIMPEATDPEVGRAQEAEMKDALAIALRAELQQTWDIDDEIERELMERMLAPDVGNRPLHVLHEISLLNGGVFANPDFNCLDVVAATEMDRSLTRFQDILGACEKILRTPIYTPYSKLCLRAGYVWCALLPLALYPTLGSAVVPASLVISFFILGIEDIGSRVEQPFNVMPLWQYCQVIDTSCVQIVRATDSHLKRQKDHVSDKGLHDFHSSSLDTLNSWADPLAIDPSMFK